MFGLVALRDRRTGRNAEHEIADVVVGQHRVDDLADEPGVAHADGGVVERVLGHRIAGQQCGQALDRRRRERRQCEADVVGEIERDVLHRAGPGDEGGALGRRHRKARQDRAAVEQLVERIDDHHGFALEQCRRGGVVACQCAGVRLRGLAGACALAGHQQHDRLAGFARLRRQAKEERGASDLLHIHRDHARLRVGDEVGEHVLDAHHRFVAGRHRRGQRLATADEGVAQVGGHGAALGQHADPRTTGARVRRDRFEGQRYAGLEVGEAHAVGAEQQHAGSPGDVGQLLLLRAALVAGFGVAGRVDHHGADLAGGAGADGVEHTRFGDRQHGDIDARRQIVDRLHAGTGVDLGAAAAHEVDRARVAELLEVGEHEAAEGARVGRRADDRNRAGLEQAGDGTGLGGERGGVGHGAGVCVNSVVAYVNSIFCTPQPN